MTRIQHEIEVRCPVCNATMDVIFSTNHDGQGFASLANMARQIHGAVSPDCEKDAKWLNGWTTQALGVVEVVE